MTTTAKKANRGHLLRAAKAGKLWVKCRFHLTDDYAHDAASNNGTMSEFKQACLRESFSQPAPEHMVTFRDSDFRTKSGHIQGTTKAGTFSVHSNLCYFYEIR